MEKPPYRRLVPPDTGSRACNPNVLQPSRSRDVPSSLVASLNTTSTISDIPRIADLTTQPMSSLQSASFFTAPSEQRIGPSTPSIEMLQCGFLPSFIDYEISKDGLTFGGRYYPRPMARGLVLLSYGQLANVFDDKPYYKTGLAYLVKCLWFHKYAVAVVFSGDVKLKRPPVLDLHVSEIIEKHTSSINKLDGLPLILVGTSESGHAMASFAYQLKVNLAVSHKYFPGAAAVIGLGPAGTQLEVYAKDFSPNYLIIAGVQDGEVNIQSSMAAYEYHDVAFGFKSLVWLHGANHAGFVEFSTGIKTNDGVDLPGRILARTQQLVVAQYVTMFCLMVTKNEDYVDYKAVFKGDKIINFTSADFDVDKDLKTKFRAMPLYESKWLQPPLTSGTNKITFVSLFQNGDQKIDAQKPPVYAPLATLAPNICFQSALGYRVNWANGWAINPSLVVQIAAEVRYGPEPKYLEFDAVQMPLSIFNADAELDVQAKLVYVGKYTKAVGFRIQRSRSFAAPFQPRSRAVLSTIRLAVADFGIGSGQFVNVTHLIIELGVSRPAGEILFTGFRWTV